MVKVTITRDAYSKGQAAALRKSWESGKADRAKGLTLEQAIGNAPKGSPVGMARAAGWKGEPIDSWFTKDQSAEQEVAELGKQMKKMTAKDCAGTKDCGCGCTKDEMFTPYDSELKKHAAGAQARKVDAPKPKGRNIHIWMHGANDARPSAAALAARGALQNLQTIVELAQEARQLEGNHAANAVWIRNAGDIRRWVAALKAAGVDVPPAVKGAASLFGGM